MTFDKYYTCTLFELPEIRLPIEVDAIKSREKHINNILNDIKRTVIQRNKCRITKDRKSGCYTIQLPPYITIYITGKNSESSCIYAGYRNTLVFINNIGIYDMINQSFDIKNRTIALPKISLIINSANKTNEY